MRMGNEKQHFWWCKFFCDGIVVKFNLLILFNEKNYFSRIAGKFTDCNFSNRASHFPLPTSHFPLLTQYTEV